ncbi:MAG TPA: hypothetical protein VHU86_00155 [Solirubrobacterales bacterium]|nr:hypothetical protein [Solirubrobacterales bacterium]
MAAALLALAAALAAASEVSRNSYREAVEPICQANTRANERILGGVRSEVKRNRLGPAALRFAKAAKALKRTLRELQAVPQPAVDQPRLARWFRLVGAEASLFERVAAKLRASQKGAAEAMVIRLEHNAQLANDAVLPFEFQYCRFEPSRFT